LGARDEYSSPIFCFKPALARGFTQSVARALAEPMTLCTVGVKKEKQQLKATTAAIIFFIHPTTVLLTKDYQRDGECNR
jgi:hypothetical protein